MYKVRGQGEPEAFWGVDTQPERLDAVLRYTPSGARILDLGTGRGAYTGILNNMGFPTVGVDSYHYPEWDTKPDGWFVQASASSLPFPDRAFHTTILFEVLEHCSNPKAVLEEIARCTSEQLILSVPNCDLNNQLRQYDLALAHWTDPTHCNFFTKESIKVLLNDCNYKVIELSDCYKISPNNYFWDTIKLPRIIKKPFKKIFEKLKLVETYYSSILVVTSVQNSTK